MSKKSISFDYILYYIYILQLLLQNSGAHKGG